MTLLKFSTSLDQGDSGILGMGRIPCSSRNVLNWPLEYGGPLSDFKSLGLPCEAKKEVKCFRTASKDSDFVKYISGHFENWSKNTCT